ncbi:hypothetical protein niasHT_017676 [Heterodera trifolii]|uniref:Prospero domain-containing protein n=1 Tax=Heterodera trifolii TaxID=157864 RepID=A0ABD2L8D9_9BILA
MSLCNDESSLPYNKFGQQNAVTIVNGQDDNEEEDEEERQPVTNEHGEDEHKMEEQMGEEDLHFPPSFVCWSQPLPIITSVSSNASYSSSSVASAHGDGDGEQHSEDNDVQQKQQQNGECLFEQIAKLAEMDSFENVGNDQQQTNGRHCTADGYEEKEMAIALASCQPSPILNGGANANAVVVVANEQPKIGKSNNNWALSSTSASASSSARRKSFNPVRIKEEQMQTENDGREHGTGAETNAVEQQQQKQHSHAFNKRHDEGEEGADDEQMGPINRQQMNNKVNLFMDNNNMSILSSTTPLNEFTQFPPQLFPLEADEEESSADGQLQKDDGDEDDASVREKKPQYNNLGYFARFLKTELAGACAGAVDKVVGDFSTNSSSSASNGSSVDNNRDHVDEQYAQQCQQQQHQNAVQQQQFQAVQARLWTAALALAATRQQQQQQQQQHQLLPDQHQPQFVPAAAGTCRPPASQPPFSLASSMVVPSCTMRGGGGMAQMPNSTFPWFSVPTMPTMNSAAVATLFAAAQQNPFFSTAIGAFLANAAAQSTVAPTSRGGGGIFPPPPVPTQSTMAAAAAHNLMSDQQNLSSTISAQCSPTNGHYYHHKQSQQHNNYPLRLSHRSSADCDDSPRRKRAKVTDCVRGPRSSLHRDFAAFSAANTPQHHHQQQQQQQTPANSTAATIVPTMVPRASELDTNCRRLIALRCGGAGGQNAIDGDSGDGTGQMNATGDNDELAAISINPHRHLHRAALTHMHLRKAKLMFFYQRYPTSSLLKSYFPDVQFTKHNTAQLVKWFSNFREFFYMQMEKFAKQAIVEGVQHADEIYVTTESEVFKQLQQHYNKNNAFQPPERLLFVIQETLKEFYNALKEGRDKESSWKKAIYKVIQQLDEPIPEFFREPQFVELLEQNN